MKRLSRAMDANKKKALIWGLFEDGVRLRPSQLAIERIFNVIDKDTKNFLTQQISVPFCISILAIQFRTEYDSLYVFYNNKSNSWSEIILDEDED